MHYVDEGSGPVVLMVHGNPTWSFYYRELIKGLSGKNYELRITNYENESAGRDPSKLVTSDHIMAQSSVLSPQPSYRVVAPDHIGMGLSDKPQDYPYRLATHIDNLEKLVEHLGLKDITLAVHDWGGVIGFGLAMRRPELFRRFVIFNTAAFFGPCPWRIRICRWPIMGTLLVRVFNGFAGTATWIACKKRDRMMADVKRGYLLPYQNYHDRIAIHRFVQDIPLEPNHPTRVLIQQIDDSLKNHRDKPMVIFWGIKDFCFNAQYLDEWIRRFSRAVVHRFEDAGHYVVEDSPEQIEPLLLRFLEES